MYKSLLLTCVLASAVLSGCASTEANPTFSDVAHEQSAETKKIAKQWDQGQKLIKQSKRDIEDSKDYAEKAEDYEAKAKEYKVKAEKLKAASQKKEKEGKALVASSEAAYTELRRNMLPAETIDPAAAK